MFHMLSIANFCPDDSKIPRLYHVFIMYHNCHLCYVFKVIWHFYFVGQATTYQEAQQNCESLLIASKHLIDLEKVWKVDKARQIQARLLARWN